MEVEGEINLPHLLPFDDKIEVRLWKRLHMEIRQFGIVGILYPIINGKIGDGEHFCNHNMDPIRILPLLLYDRITDLPAATKRRLVPDTGGRYIFKSRAPNRKQAWKCDTDYMRKRYDRWYWDMRLKRTPYTVALRAPLKHMKSNIQRRIHFYHVDAAVERNRQLTGPPYWLFQEYYC